MTKMAKTSGKFKTREELEQTVWFLWKVEGQKPDSIAKACDVSVTTVRKILKKRL